MRYAMIYDRDYEAYKILDFFILKGTAWYISKSSLINDYGGSRFYRDIIEDNIKCEILYEFNSIEEFKETNPEEFI